METFYLLDFEGKATEMQLKAHQIQGTPKALSGKSKLKLSQKLFL